MLHKKISILVRGRTELREKDGELQVVPSLGSKGLYVEGQGRK